MKIPGQRARKVKYPQTQAEVLQILQETGWTSEELARRSGQNPYTTLRHMQGSVRPSDRMLTAYRQAVAYWRAGQQAAFGSTTTAQDIGLRLAEAYAALDRVSESMKSAGVPVNYGKGKTKAGKPPGETSRNVPKPKRPAHSAAPGAASKSATAPAPAEASSTSPPPNDGRS